MLYGSHIYTCVYSFISVSLINSYNFIFSLLFGHSFLLFRLLSHVSHTYLCFSPCYSLEAMLYIALFVYTVLILHLLTLKKIFISAFEMIGIDFFIFIIYNSEKNACMQSFSQQTIKSSLQTTILHLQQCFSDVSTLKKQYYQVVLVVFLS